MVSENELALDGNVVGTGGLTESLTVGAQVGFCAGYGGVLSHGVFLPALSFKIMVIAHDGVDWDAVRTFRLAYSAGMTAVERTASFPEGSQFLLIRIAQSGTGKADKPFQVIKASHGTADSADIGIAQDKPHCRIFYFIGIF